jgi:hypothetical protein
VICRRRKIVLFACLLAACVATGSRCSAQEDRQQKQQQSPQQNSYHDQAQMNQRDQQQKGSSQSISGKVSEKHGKYYLEEDMRKTSYELQGTWELKQFLGKKVRVTGTVDSEHNILHVVAITKIP